MKKTIAGMTLGLWMAACAQAAPAYDLTVLPTLGGRYSWATAINASGQVIGDSYLAGDRGSHGFLFSEGELYDLNDLIDPLARWSIMGARAMNDSGQIVAYGCGANGCRDVLLTLHEAAQAGAVPEPSSLALLGMGLMALVVGMGASARRTLRHFAGIGGTSISSAGSGGNPVPETGRHTLAQCGLAGSFALR